MVIDQSDRIAAGESRDSHSVDERLQDIDPLSGGWSDLTRQADEVLDETTDAVEVVSHLDLGLYAQHDPFPDGHDSKPFEPMLRAVLFGELTDASDAAVHRTLDDTPDVATALDFDPDDVPDRSTISRARRHRFEALETKIDVSTRQIKTLAALPRIWEDLSWMCEPITVLR